MASSSQAVAAPRPARKKKKKSLKGARQGRLSAILERMPVEILSEVTAKITFSSTITLLTVLSCLKFPSRADPVTSDPQHAPPNGAPGESLSSTFDEQEVHVNLEGRFRQRRYWGV